MAADLPTPSSNGAGRPPEHLDVLIVGGGLSGIGAACHLRRGCPGKSFAVLEGRAALGGTWDLFRYPGIRSDSDMFTLGYSFRPWEQPEAIADGPAILDYIHSTARRYRVTERVRLQHRVVSADFSSTENRWTVVVERGPERERIELTCDFLFGCTGYFRYDEGFSPEFPGRERFRGEIVHPQHWPEDLDYSGKRVVVVGSGATAVTLVPAMAAEADGVTMLQRSPSYVVSLPRRDRLALLAQRLLPSRIAYPLMRWKNVAVTQLFFQLSRRAPRVARALVRRGVLRSIPAGIDVDTHFNPDYEPWDQRVCLVPDGDLFESLRRGEAEIVTGRIRTFTEHGVELGDGRVLPADLIVTATGLNLLTVGGIELGVDGEPIEIPATVAYKGLMLSGVPNFALTLGYTNASWTLKADLVATYVCRLLRYMDARGLRRVTPKSPPPSAGTEPIIDLQAGYVLRSLDQLPSQGDRPPWRLRQNYPLDLLTLRHGPIDDEGVEFAAGPARPAGRVAGSRAAPGSGTLRAR
jgi:monooxygenase